MKAKTLVERAQISSSAPTDIIEVFGGLSIIDPKTLASRIATASQAKVADTGVPNIPRYLLADIASAFHKRADTLTPAVLEAIERLRSGRPIIRVAHQANLFSYLNIAIQPLLLGSIGRELERKAHPVVEVFLVVDYDASSDKRFARSSYPDLSSRTGLRSMSALLRKRERDVLMCYVEKPTAAQTSAWISQVREIVRRDVRAIGHAKLGSTATGVLSQTLTEICDMIRDAEIRSVSLADFNAIILSKLSNTCWGLPTVFIPGSLVMPHLKSQLSTLMKEYPRIVESVAIAVSRLESLGVEIGSSVIPQPGLIPLWYICNDCQSRVELRNSRIQEDMVGQCRNCGADFSFSVAALQDDSRLFVPRIILDNLLEGAGWGIVGGVGYIGAAEHELISGLVAASLGWRVPIDLMWRSRGIYYGTAEGRFVAESDPGLSSTIAKETVAFIFRGAASLLYYLMSQGIQGLSEMWNRHWESGGSVLEVVRGARNFIPRLPDHTVLESLAVDQQIGGVNAAE